MSRSAEVHRVTGETDVTVRVDLDGEPGGEASTGVGFLDHMLALFARHGLMRLDVAARGDVQTGSHHTIEDVGITIGQALDRALGDRAGIERYGAALVPMDEVLVRAAVDVSGRPHLALRANVPAVVLGGYESECLAEFLRGLATHARLTLHVDVLAPGGVHHLIEGVHKAVARALAAAARPNPRVSGVPSTKGLL